MPFESGENWKGNANGRPVGTRNFTTKVREALMKIADGKDYTYEEAFIKSILKNAIVDGDQSTQRLIWNYLDGMPPQKLQHEGDLILRFHSSLNANTPLPTGEDNKEQGEV